MSKVSKFIEQRLKEIELIDRKNDEVLRPVSTRMSPDEIEKLGNVAGILEMSKSELVRELVASALDDIIEKYNMSFGPSIGMSQLEMHEFELMSPEEKEKFIAKIQAEAAAKKEGELNE